MIVDDEDEPEEPITGKKRKLDDTNEGTPSKKMKKVADSDSVTIDDDDLVVVG